MVQGPPPPLCDWPSSLSVSRGSRPMVSGVPPARGGQWKAVPRETPPTRAEIGYVARRAGTEDLKDEDYDSRLPEAGPPLHMRTGGMCEFLYKRGAEGWEAAVGSWQRGSADP